MLRVGYPAKLDPSFLDVMPPGVELIALPDDLDHEIAVDVWIPDPLSNRAVRVWPYLRCVRLVLSMMAGTEWIPGTVGTHVTICNAHGAHNIATAEWTVTAILAVLKNLPLFLDIQQSRNWRRRKEADAAYERITGDRRPLHPPVMQEELTAKKVLLVGYGAIGKEIERMLAPFHVAITRIARTGRTDPVVHPVGELDALLPDAEIIILILPLTEQTHGLIGSAQFERMRQGALLVNAARGPIVQTDALIEALNAGRIRAALDVTDPEPPPEDHPLWRCPNLLITPHIGASTPEFARRSLQVAADELRRYMNGEPLHNAVQLAV
ncbi:hydroxyacid dehydrogenase [Acidobacteria bacterium AB60]|nr:hydroxyacid dehydrogenase [Acidobacteria bacterium AB60]